MEFGPFYTGQVPREALTFIVRDVVTNEVIDLSTYTSGVMLLQDPDREVVDTSDGDVVFANPTGGEVQYEWPSTSLLTKVGDYKVQMQLTGTGGVVDFTVPQSFKVYRSLGGT